MLNFDGIWKIRHSFSTRYTVHADICRDSLERMCQSIRGLLYPIVMCAAICIHGYQVVFAEKCHEICETFTLEINHAIVTDCMIAVVL